MAAPARCCCVRLYREPVAATFQHQKVILINQILSVATFGSNPADLKHPSLFIQKHRRCIAVTMATADDKSAAGHSEHQEEKMDTATGPGQTAAASESDEAEYQQPARRRKVRRGCQIDWMDQSTLSPSTPKNNTTIEQLEKAKKAKKKEQWEIAKATKAAKRKQKALAEKASLLSNEELLEIVNQRRHRQQEKINKGKAKAAAGKNGIQ